MAMAIAARAAEPERTISQLMSDLQRLQVQMAFGDKAAYALQRDRLRTIGVSILAAKPETWKDKDETDAAVAYVLSGADSRASSHNSWRRATFRRTNSHSCAGRRTMSWGNKPKPSPCWATSIRQGRA
jgi:hypothetical protein